MRTVAVIPVRFGSKRFPGKPLADLCGKPLLQWVYEGVRSAETLDEVLVATDDERIREAAEGFGATVVMTGDTPRNGTERVAEAMQGRDGDLVVNVQGDEPLLTGELVDLAVRALREDNGAAVSTLAVPLAAAESGDVNAVKVVLDGRGRALYFSRSPIPYPRNEVEQYLLHIGIYVYRRELLERYPELPRSPLERSESLEQLRVLEAGERIRVVVTEAELRGVDSVEDLEVVAGVLLNAASTEDSK